MYKKILSIALLAGNAWSGTMGVMPDWTWVGAISAGPAWNSGGRTQTLFLTPEIEKAYVANRSNNTVFDGELFLGIQTGFTQMLQGQLGLAVGFNNNTRLSGVIWDDADPLFDNFVYDYKIQHTYLAIQGKLLADMNFWLIPWISASIGAGFNDAHSFHSIPTIFEAVPTPDFASHTQTAFTYTLGAGVQKALNTHWQLGMGYVFADWGKSSLGRAEGQTLNSGLTLNHLYTNSVLFNVTYVA